MLFCLWSLLEEENNLQGIIKPNILLVFNNSQSVFFFHCYFIKRKNVQQSPFQHNKETEGPTNGQLCTKPLWALSPKRNPLRKELTACPPRVRTPSILRHVSRRESAIFHRRCKGEATDFRHQRNWSRWRKMLRQSLLHG